MIGAGVVGAGVTGALVVGSGVIGAGVVGSGVMGAEVMGAGVVVLVLMVLKDNNCKRFFQYFQIPCVFRLGAGVVVLILMVLEDNNFKRFFYTSRSRVCFGRIIRKGKGEIIGTLFLGETLSRTLGIALIEIHLWTGVGRIGC